MSGKINPKHSKVMKEKWKDPAYRKKIKEAHERRRKAKKAAAIKKARETAFQVRETIERLDREELADYIKEQQNIVVKKVEEIGRFLKSLLRIQAKSDSPRRRKDFLLWAKSVGFRLRALYAAQQRLDEAELRQDYLGYGTGKRRGGEPPDRIKQYIFVEDDVEHSDEIG